MTDRVLEYTGRELTLQTGVGAGIKRFPRSEVIEVTTPYLEAHQRGLDLLSQGRVKDADAAFETALDEEPRTWVRRSILASQMKCAWWTGDYTRAANRFLPIAESDLANIAFGLAPYGFSFEPSSTSCASTKRRRNATRSWPGS